MKIINFMLVTTLVTVSFSACKDASKETAKQDAINVNMYVDSIEKITPVYNVGYWNIYDSMYQVKAMQAEMTLSNLDTTDKEKLEASKIKYAKMKADYEAKLIAKQAESDTKINQIQIALADEKDKSKMMNTSTTVIATAPDYRQVLRNKLFGEGKIGVDMKFEFVNAKNILSIYKNFVNSVANNKKKYTREDWDEIKVLYEALDNKKNSVEKDLATKDNLDIAGLKIRFVTIKAGNRFSAKADENSESKK